MTGKTIEFFWDVGSTNTYFALRFLVPLAERFDATINWHPFNLGHVFQSNSYVLMDEPKTKLRNRRRDLARWARRYNLPFSVPDRFPIRTSLALKGAIAMRRWQLEAEFIDAIFTAYWENNEGGIGEYPLLRTIAASLGVDPEEFEREAERADTRQQLIDSTNNAIERGVFGAPSFIIDDELYWGKDRMDFIEAHLAGKPY